MQAIDLGVKGEAPVVSYEAVRANARKHGIFPGRLEKRPPSR